jgi:hypothetical protein
MSAEAAPSPRGIAAVVGAPSRQRTPFEWSIAALLLAAGVFGSILPDLGYFTKVPGDIGDPRFNSVVLEHLYRIVTGTQAALWSPDFFFPFTGTLAFSDNHLGSGLVYVAARLLGAMREHAFDVWYLTGVVLNFVAALYALKRFGFSIAASAVGGFLFTFAIPVLAQNGHAQLVYRFAIPLAALAFWEAFERRRLLDLVRVVFWTTWQFYCSIYLGIFLGYLLAAMAVVLVLQNRSVPLRPWLTSLADEKSWTKVIGAAVVIAAVAALTYLLGTYFAVSRLYHLGRTFDDITDMLPRWASYLVADVSPWLDGIARSIPVPTRHEHQMFVGFAAVGLMLVGVAATRRRRALLTSRLGVTMIWSFILLMIGTLWIGGFSLYYLIAWISGISSVRAVTRIVLVMLLPMSVLVALGVDFVRRSLERRKFLSFAAPAILAALITAEPLNVPPRSDTIAMWQERQAAVRALLPAQLAANAIVWVRTGSDVQVDMFHAELDGMILGQDIRRPTLNGYSGNEPPGNIGSSSCDSVEEKLKAYSDFMGGIDVSGYAERVVTLDLSPCTQLP